MVESTLQPQAAAYTLGKLHSKYIILDIFGFAGHRLFAMTLLFTSSHNLKSLIIKNFQLLRYCVEDQQMLELTSLSQLLYPQLIFNRRLSIDNKNDIVKGILHLQTILGKKQQLDLHSLKFEIDDYFDDD